MRATYFSALIPLLAACSGTVDPPPVNPPCHGKCDGGGAGVSDVDGDGTSVCLALRGNGPRITAHFGAIARFLEHHGLVDGVAGGSSGSVTAFLLESVELNPAVYQCDGGGCTNQQAGERAAFLFKSVRGYVEVLTDTDEALAFAEIARVAAAIEERGIDGLLERDPGAGVAALETLLRSPELRALLNPEVVELLASSPDPEFHARDLVATIKRGLAFEATDATIFARPGLVSFPGFVERLGRVGSFYAGAPPSDQDGLAALLDTCATATVGMTWAEAAEVPYLDATCGDGFRALVSDWRSASLAEPDAFPSRLDDEVGGSLPALVTTGVLEGDAIAAWHRARADYLAGRPVELTVHHDEVGVGYFGAPADLEAIVTAGAQRLDLKSRKRRALGGTTWRNALETSPAEPGLSRGIELDDGRISVGGWSDLQPVLVLEDLGCDQIVLVTREGGAGSFETGIGALLGVDDAAAQALYALDDPASSYYHALDAATGVWCSDWDAPPAGDLDQMTAIGYDAPFESRDRFFTEAATPVPNLTAETGIAGCSLGVAD